MTPKQINTISKDSNVTQLYSGTSYVKDDLDISRQAIRANQIQTNSMFGYTGNGVRVGMLESGVPNINHASLINADITINPQATSISDHATRVATIIAGQENTNNAVGIAPNVSLFCTSTNESLKDSFDWFIENNVDIINMSFHYQYEVSPGIYQPYVNTYTQYDKIVDFYSSKYSIIVVKSSGNEGNLGVTSPGMAYNAITVASCNDNNTKSVTDDSISSFSSFMSNNSNNLASKPDITAPGENIYIDGLNLDGTSYSAPHITGAIALMGEQDILVLTSPSLAKAVLAAGTFSAKRFTPAQQSGTNSYKYFGAGIVNCGANAIILNNMSWDYTVLYDDESYFDISVSLTVNSNSRIALAFENMITANSNQTTYTAHVNNIDLKIYNPSGSLVASSVTTNNNLEIVDFTPTVSGLYKIRICRANTNGSVDVRLAYAYV